MKVQKAIRVYQQQIELVGPPSRGGDVGATARRSAARFAGAIGRVCDPAVPLGSRHLHPCRSRHRPATNSASRIISARSPPYHESATMDGSLASPPARPFRRPAVIALILAAVTFAVYSPTFLDHFE